MSFNANKQRICSIQCTVFTINVLKKINVKYKASKRGTKIISGRKLKRNYQHNYAICTAIVLLVQIIKYDAAC